MTELNPAELDHVSGASLLGDLAAALARAAIEAAAEALRELAGPNV
jgi:hypothetical protein